MTVEMWTKLTIVSYEILFKPSGKPRAAHVNLSLSIGESRHPVKMVIDLTELKDITNWADALKDHLFTHIKAIR